MESDHDKDIRMIGRPLGENQPSAASAGYDLKPCPFCGKKLFIVDRKNNPYARCSSDECYGRKLPLLNLDDPGAIKAWNKRS